MRVINLKKILVSRQFLIAVFSLFILQGIFYAGSIRYGLPPDEAYHFESIAYYANENISEGPFIENQPPETIGSVRTIERSSSYLYHYTLSFPLRILQNFSLSHDVQVFILRLINVMFAALTLYVLKRCLDEISGNRLLNNLAITGLSLTGMFIWLSGAINYDNLANLLFVAFLWQIARFVKKPVVTTGLLAVSVGLAASLTKYTFLPEVFVGVLVIGFFLFKKYRTNIQDYYRDLRNSFSANKIKTIVITSLFVVFSLLFIERVGVNLIRFHQIQPTCPKIHSVTECLANPLFKRNYDQKIAFSPTQSTFINSIDPFNHTGSWFYRMYSGTYFYFGHKTISSNPISEIVVAVFILFFGATLFLSRKKLKVNKAFWIVAGIVVLYAVMLYLFNLRTLLSYGERFAYQGRYLLPVLGFLYLFVGTVILNTAKNMEARRRKIFLTTWGIIFVTLVLTHFSILIFFSGVDETWYNGNFLDLINP